MVINHLLTWMILQVRDTDNLMEEIRGSPVEVGSLSRCLLVYKVYTSIDSNPTAQDMRF